MTTLAPVRGCGTRKPGGAYLCASLGERGIPLEALVVDPPVPVDPLELGVSAVGMTLATGSQGQAVVYDWVGAEHYPNPADYIEETALFGSSRRVPTSFDFASLGPGAVHVLIHPRAVALNPEWALTNRPDRPVAHPSYLHRACTREAVVFCPFGQRLVHENQAVNDESVEWCAALWWECLLPDTATFAGDVDGFDDQTRRRRPVTRTMPSFEYRGYVLPDADIWTPEWAPGLFLQLPITRVEVVRDPEDLLHEPVLDRARRASIPVLEVDE